MPTNDTMAWKNRSGILKKRHKPKPEAEADTFPSGVIVVTDSGRYLIQNGTRLRVPSDSVARSWSFPASVHTKESRLKSYPIIGVLGYRGGTVIYSLEDGYYYLIEKNKKRQIVNSRWFDYLGMNRLDSIVASSDEVKLHKTGEVLN